MKKFVAWWRKEFFYKEMWVVYLAYMVSSKVYLMIFGSSGFSVLVWIFLGAQIYWLNGLAEKARDERLAKQTEVVA